METFGEHPDATDLIRHAAWLRRLAVALVGDLATADDLVQETFVAALSRPPRGGHMPRAWLARVVRNAAKQTFRSRDRRTRREAESAEPQALPGPRETVERLDTERCLTEELARLDEPFRTTLMLRYYDGLAPAEIAARTSTPGGTVRWRLQRGLELLRERLDGRFGQRAAWCALFLPITRSQPLAVTTASTSALPGIILMSTLWKVAAIAGCALAIAIGLMVSGVLPGSMPTLAGDTPLEVAFRPISSHAYTLVLEVFESEDGARSAIPSAVPESTPAPTASPARVEARVVDTAGVPLAGVELRRLDVAGPIARSTADGHVALSLELDERPRSVSLEFRAPGYASRGEKPVLAAGGSAHLGTLVLEPGGVVSGRVLDVSGKGIENARVAFEPATETSRALQARRIAGGFTSVPMTRTDANGRYDLVGLGAGFVRVCAEAPGFLAGFTPPVAVRAGQETYDVELRLEPLPAANRLRGVVIDPSGAPVARARLEFRHESRSTGTTTTGSRSTDAEGRFEFRLPDDARTWLTAHDPAGRFAATVSKELPTGGADVVLQLAEAPRIALVVSGSKGQAVEAYAFDVLSPDQRTVHERAPLAPRAHGTADFQRPSSEFVVAIEAPGHQREILGPFDPVTVAPSLMARLVPVPGLHGRVMLADRLAPAVGAKVTLHELAPEGDEYLVNGFLSRFERGAVSEAQCDADGAFLLTVRHPGAYAVRAERAGHAPAESAVVSVGPDLHADDVELVFGLGGTLEGRVRRSDGSDPAGTILGVSRGDGFPRTLRVGPEGTFRLERLTPGPWWIDVRSEELDPGTTTTLNRGRKRKSVDPTCHVVEGQTTWHEVEINAAPTCIVEGCLRVDGAPAQAWMVRLVPHEVPFFQDESEGKPFDIEGCFRIDAKKAGTYWLVLTGAHEQYGDHVLVDVLELAPGVARWEKSIRTGTLVVDGSAEWTGKDVPVSAYHWEGGDKLFGLTIIAATEEGVARVPSVPAGKGRIVRPDATNFDFAKWPTLIEVEVPAGGEVRVRLP